MWISLLKTILVQLLGDLIKFAIATPKEVAKQTSTPLMPDLGNDLDSIIKKYDSVSTK